MRFSRKLPAFALAVCLLWLLVSGVAAGQQPKSIVSSSKGEGTIKIGKEKFALHAVVVKFFEDGTAEINLITDITVFVSGTWSRGDDAEKVINLKIAGGVVPGNLDGSGKLLLSDDRKSIVGLKMQVVHKITRKIITADFAAK